MLTIKVESRSFFDEEKSEFVDVQGTTLQLEHSLISISKWETKWHKPFLGPEKKTAEQTLDYIRMMTVNKVADDTIYYGLTNDQLEKINSYIADSATATSFVENGPKVKNAHSREIITSELIYYWLIAYNIPFECQKWHLNRLLTLVRVCEIKNRDPKKMNRGEILKRNHALNEERLKKLGTTG